MKLKLSLDEAKSKAMQHLSKGYHCGPTTLKVMCEAYGLENEELLPAATVFRGGIAGQQKAPCGALSGAGIALGFCNARANSDKEKAEQSACNEAAELVKSFEGKFGSITCIGLLGVEFTNEEAVKHAKDSGLFANKCPEQIKFVIEKLYEFEQKR